MIIPYNDIWLFKKAPGLWDVIKRCGSLVAENVSEYEAYIAADRVRA